MKQMFLALVATMAFTSAAYAQNFVSAYAPREGERATIQVEKCRSDDAGQNLEANCTRLTYREVVLAPGAGGVLRIGYTLQSVTLPNGQQLNEAALRDAGMSVTMIVQADEGGAALRIENRAEVMAASMAAFRRLEGERFDQATADAARTMVERMDDAGFAQMNTRDLAPLTIFQAIDANVGEPVTGQLQIPFPLNPSQLITSNAQLLVTAMDRGAGTVRATYTQVTDEASVVEAMRALLAQLPAERRPDLANVRVSVRDEAQGLIDLASGRTLEVVHTRTAEVSVGAQRQLRVERVTMRRRML